MIAPLLRSLGLLAQFVLLALLALFLIARATPGGTVGWLSGPAASAIERRAAQQMLAVDRAVHVQFLRFSGRVLRGDLGRSARSGAPVLSVVATSLAGTLALLAAAGALALVMSVALEGGLAALGASGTGRLAAACALAGLMAQVPLAVIVGWLAPDILAGAPAPALLAPLLPLVPGIVLLAVLAAGLMTLDLRQLLRAGMTSPSAIMAQARGFGRWHVLRHDAMPRALPQLARDMVIALPRLLGLTLLLEALVTGTGLGSLVFTALSGRDLPVLAGVTLVLLLLGLALRTLPGLLSGWRAFR
jgi:peptide/nickel transport system permease protein